LTEHHGHELRPAGEAFCVPFGLTLLDQRGEFGSGEMLQKLIEQTGNQYQGNALLERVMEPTRVCDSLTTMTGGHVPPQPAGGAGRRRATVLLDRPMETRRAETNRGYVASYKFGL